MGIWNRDLPQSIGVWLEPLCGILFVYIGIKAIVTEELRMRMWIYHGAAAVLGGVAFVLAAYLMFRGCIWRKRSWNALDKVVGVLVGVALVIELIYKWVSIVR